MVRVLIVLLFAQIASSLCCATVSAEFTVDNRSFLHFGASAAIGTGVSATMYTLSDNPMQSPWTRRIAAGLVCLVPGVYKGLAMDSHPDWGDFTFNIGGCASGVYAGEHGAKYVITPFGICGEW